MHLVAGVVSAAIAVLVALYLAVTLSRPLRSIRAGAEAMSAGDLDARVPESGDDEIARRRRRPQPPRRDAAAGRGPAQGERRRPGARAAHARAGHPRPRRGRPGRRAGRRGGQPLGDARRGAAPGAPARRPLGAGRGRAAGPAARGRAGRPRRDRRGAGGGVRRQRSPTRTSPSPPTCEPAIVDGEPRRLEQIVVNLLSNALRYTDAGGAVTRRRARRRRRRRSSRWRTPASASRPRTCRACSRGSGAARSRAPGPPAAPASGSSIVKELVQAHGGDDRRGERAGRGVRLPRQPSRRRDGAAELTPVGAAVRRRPPGPPP